jgi:hypothetical protein
MYTHVYVSVCVRNVLNLEWHSLTVQIQSRIASRYITTTDTVFYQQLHVLVLDSSLGGGQDIHVGVCPVPCPSTHIFMIVLWKIIENN